MPSLPDLVLTPGSDQRGRVSNPLRLTRNGPAICITHFTASWHRTTGAGRAGIALISHCTEEEAEGRSLTQVTQRNELGKNPTKTLVMGPPSPSPATRPSFGVATEHAHVAARGQGPGTLRRGPARGVQDEGGMAATAGPTLCPPSRAPRTQGKGPSAGNRVPRVEPLGARGAGARQRGEWHARTHARTLYVSTH